MTIVYKELAGSPKETFDKDGLKATRRFLCDWGDRHNLLKEITGTGEEFGRTGPAAYPGRDDVFGTQGTIEPFKSATPDSVAEYSDLTDFINEYTGKLALVVVQYKTLPSTDSSPTDLPDTDPGTFLTYTMDFSGEYMTVPLAGVRWESSADLPVDEDVFPNIRIPIVEHHLTWSRVINPPWSAIREMVGCVNQSAFMGAAAQTVLFDGVRSKKEFIYFNDFANPFFGWEIEYVFREKSIKYLDYGGNEAVAGWCHSFRSATSDAEPELVHPGWDRLTWGGDMVPNYIYREKAFAALFHANAIAE